MEYLYVCHFSNGSIKVGRSISPKSRIASHADRVGCMGIELVDHHLAKCAGYSIPAEAALIEHCTKLAYKRNKYEWFEGLDFTEICIFADACSQVFHKPPDKKIENKYEQATRWMAAIGKHFSTTA